MRGEHSTLALAAAALLACRSPTQIDVTVSTNLPCAQVSATALTTGTLGEIEKAPPTSTTTSCSSEYIGSVVLVPHGDDGALVGFKVVTAINGASVDQCMPDDAGSYGSNCIVARRALRYLAHTPLQVDVLMSGECAGKACDALSTCVEGVCVPATIGDPSQCEGNGCSEQVLEDGGVLAPTPDAAPADGTVQDAAVPDSTLPEDGAPADATLIDSSPPVDATLTDSSSPDAADAQVDAGADAGADAGGADGGENDAMPPLDASLGDGAITGCDLGGLQPGAPWPMSGYCPTRRAKSPVAGPASLPVLKWRYPATGTLNGIAASAPAVGADGTIYVALMSDVVDAVRPDGTLLWEQQVHPPNDAGYGFLAQPVIAADQTLRLLEDDNGGYTVLQLDSGAWAQTPLSAAGDPFSNVAGIAITSGGLMYFGISDGHLESLAPDGGVRWSLPSHSDELDRVAVTSSGAVFSQNSNSSTAYLYETTSGSGPVWSWPFTFTDHIRSLTIANDGTLRAFDQTTETVLSIDPSQPDAQAALRWHFELEAGGIWGLAVDDEGTTYVGGDGAGLRAFDSAGNPVGTTPFVQCGAPVLDAAENVYAWCDDQIVSYTRALAAPNWATPFALAPLFDPNMSAYFINDTVVLGTNGTVYFTMDETLNGGARVELLVALGPP